MLNERKLCHASFEFGVYTVTYCHATCVIVWAHFKVSKCEVGLWDERIPVTLFIAIARRDYM